MSLAAQGVRERVPSDTRRISISRGATRKKELFSGSIVRGYLPARIFAPQPQCAPSNEGDARYDANDTTGSGSHERAERVHALVPSPRE
jgi:hypothetical protein